MDHLRTQLVPVAPNASSLMASIEVAKLEAGHLRMPNTTRQVAIEIGCSDRETLDVQWLPLHPNGFLVSFEPALDKYAVLLARGTERSWKKVKDRSVGIGQHHSRGLVLPIAISPAGGPVPFTVHRVAGCNSMLPFNKNAWWAPWCQKVLEHRTVPSISLSVALDLVPSHLPISYLKIDAQGVDASLMRSTPRDNLRRVHTIALEVRAAHCPPLYSGQEACEDVVLFMRQTAGFSNATACPLPDARLGRKWWKAPRCETSMIFTRMERRRTRN